MIVDQLIPDEDSPASLEACQKSAVKILPIFSVSMIALPLCIVIPNTKRIISRPQPNVTMCLSIFSVMIRANITRKIRTAKICDTIMYLPHSHIIANGSRKRLTFAATIIMRSSRNWKIKFRFFENFFQLTSCIQNFHQCPCCTNVIVCECKKSLAFCIHCYSIWKTLVSYMKCLMQLIQICIVLYCHAYKI